MHVNLKSLWSLQVWDSFDEEEGLWIFSDESEWEVAERSTGNSQVQTSRHPS